MFLVGRKTRCHKVRGMLSEYIDNCLDSEDRNAVDRHLGMCEDCSNELESLQMTVRLLNQLPSVPVPRSFAIREAEVGVESTPGPQKLDGLRPVPVFAASGVKTARLSIFDPQRLHWLRPATAIATVALIALLIVDFLQVVPHDVGTGGGEILTEPPAQIMLSPTPEGEAYSLETRGDEPAEPVPGPTGKATTEDISADELGLGVTHDGGEEIAGDSVAGWPLHQIEIGIGVLVFALVALMLFARQQRRRLSRL